MAIDMIEENEQSAYGNLRVSGFVDDVNGYVFTGNNFAPVRNYSNFLGIAEGNVKKQRAIDAKKPNVLFPYNAAMNCAGLLQVLKNIEAEVDAVGIESSTESKRVVNANNNYLSRLARHRSMLENLIAQKKCETSLSNAEVSQTIKQNAEAIAAAQQAAQQAYNPAQSGGSNTGLWIGLGVVGVLGMCALYFFNMRNQQ